MYNCNKAALVATNQKMSKLSHQKWAPLTKKMSDFGFEVTMYIAIQDPVDKDGGEPMVNEYNIKVPAEFLGSVHPYMVPWMLDDISENAEKIIGKHVEKLESRKRKMDEAAAAATKAAKLMEARRMLAEEEDECK